MTVPIVAALLLVGCGSSPSEPPGQDGSTRPTSSGHAAGAPCLGQGATLEEPQPGLDPGPYIGLTLAEANDRAAPQLTIRIAGRDGECFPLTMDYRPDRVNVYLEDGIITQATVG